jgi:carbamate kinase
MAKHGIAVVAVGGNALIKDKASQTIQDQYNCVKDTIIHIVDMIENGWDVVITHGNGPQVGFNLRRSELAKETLHEVPLDYCGANTQGNIGYMLQRALHNEFKRRGLNKDAITVVTQTVVDEHDPAFEHPSKPIGSFMEELEAKSRQAKDGWTVVEDAGRGWRRVVPSPRPISIVEADAIHSLIDAGFTVVGVGGGGIPVIEREDGTLTGIEAVIDKDFGSSLLAKLIGADLFLISTAVEKVALDFNTPEQKWLDKMTVSEAKQYILEKHFASGSMLPKIQACIQFIENGGKKALITDPEHISDALEGKTGTWIVP